MLLHFAPTQSNNLQKLAAMNLKPDMEQYKRIIDDIGAIMTKHPEMTANAAALAASLTMQTGAGAVVPNIPTAPSAASGSDLGYLKAPFDEFVSGNKCLTGVRMTLHRQIFVAHFERFSCFAFI